VSDDHEGRALVQAILDRKQQRQRDAVEPGDSRLPERFWLKVRINPITGCWPWVAARGTTGGYAQYKHDGSMKYAHKVAYEVLVGEVPPETPDLDHLCEVRHCVNPDHLEPVTHKENVMRGQGWAPILAARRYCQNGHEFTADNIYIDPRRSGTRACRQCRYESTKKFNEKKRQVRLASLHSQ
jgi:hypothetical protein